jgi:GxxExxY protein
MNSDLLHVGVTDIILRVYYEVLNELGFGFIEDVFRSAMLIALRDAGLQVAEKVPLRVWFRGKRIGIFYADIVVNGVVLLELKTGNAIEPRHEAQTINYLRASDIEVGMILLFGPQARTKRLVYSSERKKRPVAGLPSHI